MRKSNKAAYERPIAMMGVGVPGTRGSEILEPYADKLGATYVSFDRLKARAEPQVTDHWAILYARARRALENGDSVVVDAPYVQLETRLEGIKRLRGFGARTILAMVFNARLERILAEAERRPVGVSEKTLREAFAALGNYPVNRSNGFDDILQVRSPIDR